MSNKKYSVELIQKCCEEYRKGLPVAVISEQNGVSRSSVYAWVAELDDEEPIDFTYKKSLAHLRAQHEKALQIIEILKRVDCTVSSPLRIAYMPWKRYRIYTVFAHCARRLMWTEAPFTTT